MSYGNDMSKELIEFTTDQFQSDLINKAKLRNKNTNSVIIYVECTLSLTSVGRYG